MKIIKPYTEIIDEINGQDILKKIEKCGVSKQNVAQACAQYSPKFFKVWTPSKCVYPNVRKWLNDNKMTTAEMVRRMGCKNHTNTNHSLREILKGNSYPNKLKIDKLLAITGLTYEKFFETDGQVGDKK